MRLVWDHLGTTGARARVWEGSLSVRAALADAAMGRQVKGVPDLSRRALQVVAVSYGVPYVWGGIDGLTGCDCTGYTYWVSRAIPGITAQPFPRAGRYQAQLGRRIDWRRARLGDLVVYTRRNGTLRHAMLALGNGWVVGARGGDENVAANRPSAFVDLRRADYWSSALSHAVTTGAAA